MYCRTRGYPTLPHRPYLAYPKPPYPILVTSFSPSLLLTLLCPLLAGNVRKNNTFLCNLFTGYLLDLTNVFCYFSFIAGKL